MFGKRKPAGELEPPGAVTANPEAVEVLRVWAAPGESQVFTLRTRWKDPGAWGLMLVDIARHAAQAYEREGHDRQTALARIRELFDAEWGLPTSDPTDMTNRH